MDYATIKYRPVRDVSVAQIVYPINTIDSTATIIPKAKIKNSGSELETFDVLFRINSSPQYTSTKTVTNLVPEDSIIIGFDSPSWTVGPRGTYTTKCSTRLAIDQDRSYDTLSGSFIIAVHDYSATSITSPTSPVDSGSTITPKAWIYNYGTTNETNIPVTFLLLE